MVQLQTSARAAALVYLPRCSCPHTKSTASDEAQSYMGDSSSRSVYPPHPFQHLAVSARAYWWPVGPGCALELRAFQADTMHMVTGMSSH